MGWRWSTFSLTDTCNPNSFIFINIEYSIVIMYNFLFTLHADRHSYFLCIFLVLQVLKTISLCIYLRSFFMSLYAYKLNYWVVGFVPIFTPSIVLIVPHSEIPKLGIFRSFFLSVREMHLLSYCGFNFDSPDYSLTWKSLLVTYHFLKIAYSSISPIFQLNFFSVHIF